jgi:hypothetical protein
MRAMGIQRWTVAYVLHFRYDNQSPLRGAVRVDTNPTRARRKAARDSERLKALDSLAQAQREVEAAERSLEAAERERDVRLLAAKEAGVRSPQLRAVLGGVSRHTVIRRVAAAQEAAA